MAFEKWIWGSLKLRTLENPVPLISDRRDSLGWGICRNKRETAICPSSHLLRGPFEALELWGMEVTQRDVRAEGTDSIPQLCAEGQNLCLLLCGACSQMPVCCMSNSQAGPLSTWHTYTHTRKYFPHFNGSPLNLQTSQKLSADRASSQFFVQSPSLCFFSYSLAQGFWLLEVPVTDLQASPLQLEEGVWTLVRVDAKFNFTLMKMGLWGIKEQTVQ